MLEIRTKFKYDWENDDLRDCYNEIVSVCGYVYYEKMLYYTCVGDSGVEVDVYFVSAENRVKNPEDY